jgi:hypothetical protein
MSQNRALLGWPIDGLRRLRPVIHGSADAVSGGRITEYEAARHSSPIFIGGTGRSGTTAVARILGLHARLFVVKWESQFMVAPNGLFDMLPKIHQKWRFDQFANRMRGEWYQRTINCGKPNEYVAGLCDDIDSEEVDRALAVFEAGLSADQSAEDRGDVAALFVNAVFEPALRRAGAHRWGEKTPRNILYIDALHAVFPRMKFIDVVRDGRDVVSSMLQHGFWPIAPSNDYPQTLRFTGEMSFDMAVDYWLTMMEISRDKAAAIPSDSYLKVRLEDIVEDPTTTLLKILDFIDEPFDEALLTYDLSRSHSGRWRTDLSPEQQQRMLEKAGDMLKEEGYL